jgi:hypothetical protein
MFSRDGTTTSRTRPRTVSKHIRSNAIGYVALFLALTLTPAWAATLGKGDVKKKNIAKNAVTAKHVKDGSLGENEFGDGVLDGLDGATGPQGPQGVKGDTGAPGPPGQNGTNGTNGTNGQDGAPGATDVIVRKSTINVGAGAIAATRADCQAGESVTGGGAGPTGITRSHPTKDGGNVEAEDGDTPTGWIGTRDNSGGGVAQPLDVYVVCASP